MERATAIIIGFVDSLATACALTDAFLASPTVTFSFSHSVATYSALISRWSIFRCSVKDYGVKSYNITFHISPNFFNIKKDRLYNISSGSDVINCP